MQDVNAPESLRDFQISYGRYLRNPDLRELPNGVPSRRSKIYEDLLFNNISGFIDNCFPVSKSLFDASQWLRIRRAFFDQWRCVTPIFSQIPYEFVRFISERPIGETLAPWLPELLHYEWIELEVDLDETPFNESMLDKMGLQINPTAKLLAYQWPVHTISAEFQPLEPKQSCLVVYRDELLKVRFNDVSPTTLMLLQFIQSWPDSISSIDDLHSLIAEFSEKIGSPDEGELIKFAMPLLKNLKQKTIITGDIV